MKRRVPIDVIRCIFSYLPARFMFKADIPLVSMFFYKIAQEEKFIELFKDYIFDESQSYPKCTQITFAFDVLQISNKLYNVNCVWYEVSEQLAIDSSTYELFSIHECALMQEIAHRFAEEMKFE